jgi:hypothetical protein
MKRVVSDEEVKLKNGQGQAHAANGSANGASPAAKRAKH